MLLDIIFITLLSTILFFFICSQSHRTLLQMIALGSAGLVLIFSSFLIIFFENVEYEFLLVSSYRITALPTSLGLYFYLDGLSLFFFFLSSFLIFLCILFIWHYNNFKFYALLLLILELLLLLLFSCSDLLCFYFLFEAILIPMFLIIGVGGSRERKIRANYLFFFFTLIGSLCFLVAIIYLLVTCGELNILYLMQYPFSQTEECLLWLAFFFSFASKVPLFPFHIWLPEAHVEAPTIGSVLLAGILLKLGVYGFLRFSLVLFPKASLFFSPCVYLLSICGVIYASMAAMRQMDLKRIIAYSSIAHMNLVTLGIFSFNTLGLAGSILQSISHGFVSSAMFLLIGILYEQYHSRMLHYYGGLVHMMPLYSIFFLCFTLANIALPGTSSFVGEFLILSGVYKVNIFCCLFASLGVILCGSYGLWLYNRVTFGNLKVVNTIIFKDLNFHNFSILLPLLFFVGLMGVYPTFFSYYLDSACINLYFLILS